MIRTLIGVVLITSLAGAQGEEALLATVPDDLTIEQSSLYTANRGGRLLSLSSLVWSADGTQVAYVGRRGETLHPVVGAKVGEAFDAVHRPILAGGHAFFGVVRVKTPSRYDCWVWIDGELVGPEDYISYDIGVSPDGKAVAYWTHPGARYGNSEQATEHEHFFCIARERKAGKWSVSRSEPYTGDGFRAPVFSADGKRAFSCGSTRKGFVVLHSSGKRVKELMDAVPMVDSIAISENGSALAFTKMNYDGSDAEIHFKGKRVSRPADDVSMPVVDARGKHVAYVARIGEQVTVAIDREDDLEGRWDHVLELAFDAKGERLACVVNTGGAPPVEHYPHNLEGGKTFVVVRPVKKGDWVDHSPFEEVRDLTWKDDRLAYCARDASGWFIVCGDERSESFDEVGPPHFAPDGSSLGFGARKANELWWILLDLGDV